MKKQKRAVAAHDISCAGRCSLTVALPILSAAGVETSVIPTAVLSTHTGGFSGFTYRDLTEDIVPIIEHWKSLNMEFDALYTGFLGSFEQIDIMKYMFDQFKAKDNLILVDPVMADNGALYKIFDEKFPFGMKGLCEKADVIVPNITEACLMLDIPYKEGPYSEEYIKTLLIKLADIGPRMIVLTGVYYDEKTLGAATYNKETNQFGYAKSEKIEGYYHGTGDIFASALLSGLLNGFDLLKSAQIAVNFTTESISRTKKAETDIRFGVNFEESIPSFIKDLN